ncbi:MAG: VanW family protein [Anaerolineae bacterium]|nr:MAG: VanW family protein [Anaerolineae bacterium]
MSTDSIAGEGREAVTTAARPLPQPQFDIWQAMTHLLLAGTLALVLGLAVALPAYELLYAGRIYPGVTAMGLSLGGLTPTEAAALLARQAPPITGPKVTLYDPGGDQRWLVSPTDLGIHLDAEAMVQAAYLPGRADDVLASLQAQVQLLYAGHDIPEVWAPDETKAALYLQLLAEQVNRPPRDATLSMLDLHAQAVPAQTGRTMDVAATQVLLLAQMRQRAGGQVPLAVVETPPQIVDATAAQAQVERFLAGPLTLALPQEEADAGELGPWVLEPADLAQMLILEVVQDAEGARRWQARLDPEPIVAFVEPIAEAVYRPPVDARLDFDDATGAVSEIAPSQPGRELDAEATAALTLERAATDQRTVALPLKVIAAEISAANAAELGIKELISEGVSYFRNSSAGRANNIAVASTRFDGVLVAPEETFSFNEHLGEVSAATGYEESVIIWGDRTRVGIGGGVCQVSTTAFRAAFWAGYPIVERHAHGFRVGWYEPPVGLDATIYAPQVDLKFRNDSPYYLLVKTEVDTASATLRFRFYSTKPDYTVEMEGPFESKRVPHPEPIYEEDPSLAPGEQVQVEWPKDGLDVTIHRLLKREGQEISRNTFFSHYLPWAARYRVGPEPEDTEGTRES